MLNTSLHISPRILTEARETHLEMIFEILVLSLLAGTGVAVPLNVESSSNSTVVARGEVTTSVTTTLTEGVEWLVQIRIANQTFNVQLDTGSADL